MSFIRIYARVISELRPVARLAIVLSLANVALAIAQFAEPILFGRIVDALARAQATGVSPTFTKLAPLITAWAAFGLFIISAGVLVALHADRLSHTRRLGTMASYFEHALTLPVSFHTTIHSGRILKVMIAGANGMGHLWLSFFREHCASFVSLVVLLPLTLFLNWRMGLVLLVLVAVFATLTTLVLRRTETLQRSVEHHHTAFAERASDALGNVPVIQSFTQIEAEATAVRKVADDLLKAQTPVLTWWAFAMVATRTAATLTTLTIFLLGTYLNIQGLATIGDIVMFMSIAGMLIGRLEQAVGFVNMVFLEAPRLAEFFEILDTVPAVGDRPGAVDPGRLRGEVAFEDVVFAYEARRTVVAGASFQVAEGQTVAVVGPTGSGKSTTLAMLHRAYDPQGGRITIDGMDVRDMKLSSLRRNIGVVFQEPMLFARTMRENMLLGKPDATDEEIMTALERAQALDVIQRQPEGLDTVVGERGRTLSGGERQRLSIARALLKDPPILILDEATSALDATTEGKLQRALEEVMKGRTTFLIAHRLATIRNADRIFVFDRGHIVEQGSFQELVALGGQFATLARSQFLAPAAEPAAGAAPAWPQRGGEAGAAPAPSLAAAGAN